MISIKACLVLYQTMTTNINSILFYIIFCSSCCTSYIVNKSEGGETYIPLLGKQYN